MTYKWYEKDLAEIIFAIARKKYRGLSTKAAILKFIEDLKDLLMEIIKEGKGVLKNAKYKAGE